MLHLSDCDGSAIFRISSNKVAIWTDSLQNRMEFDIVQTSSKLYVLTYLGGGPLLTVLGALSQIINTTTTTSTTITTTTTTTTTTTWYFMIHKTFNIHANSTPDAQVALGLEIVVLLLRTCLPAGPLLPFWLKQTCLKLRSHLRCFSIGDVRPCFCRFPTMFLDDFRPCLTNFDNVFR
jgi:hypothetical protein